MRTLAADLEAALNAGNEPYLQLQYCHNSGWGWHDAPYSIMDYKLGGLELTVHSAGHALFDAYAVRIKRGAYLNHVAYYETSSLYYVNSKYITQRDQVVLSATIFPTGTYKKYSVNGNQTYKQIIDAICTYFGYTATYEDPAAAIWSNIFYPAGRTLVLQSPHSFFTLLRQKLFIYAQDDNDNEIYFRQWLDDSIVGTAGHPSLETLTTFDWKENYSLQYRLLMWRDEASTIHYYPDPVFYPNLPVFNLGYLESTATTPTSYQCWHLNEDKRQFHLKYQDGDIIECSSGTYQIKVYETFDPKHAPSLYLQFLALPKFSTTEGGPLPSTIEAAAPYTPLNVSLFSGILDATDNNLQAAMNTIDDHVHTGVYEPLIGVLEAHHGGTGVNNGAVLLTIPATGIAALLATANVFTVQQMIDGTADQIQLRVQGFSTQTTDIFTIEKSTAQVLFGVNNSGHVGIGDIPQANYMIYNVFSTYVTAASQIALYNSVAFGYYNLSMANNIYAEYNCITIHANQANAITGALVASKGDITHTGSATLTSACCLIYQITNSGAGIITNAYGVVIQPVVNTGAGSVANKYGLYINDQVGGTSSNTAIITFAGNIIFNEGGNANTDFRLETDTYDAIFSDASNDSIVLMSNAAGKIGFLGAAAVAQHAHIADATGAADVITTCNHILSVLEQYGLLATA